MESRISRQRGFTTGVQVSPACHKPIRRFNPLHPQTNLIKQARKLQDAQAVKLTSLKLTSLKVDELTNCQVSSLQLKKFLTPEFRSGDLERGQLTNWTLEKVILTILKSKQYIQNGDLRLSKQGPNACWLSPYRDLFYFWVPIYFPGGESIQSTYIQL